MRDLLGFGLALARGVAGERMVDRCRISEVTGVTELDDGTSTPTLKTVYEGPCFVQAPNTQPVVADVGGGAMTVQRYRVDVPVGSYRPAIGQVVQILAAQRDPYLIGRRYRVVALPHKSAASAYRLGVDEEV